VDGGLNQDFPFFFFFFFLNSQPAPKQPQKTLENTREVDETIVDPNDEEVLQDEETDQFADYFKGRHPKILITTGREASGVRRIHPPAISPSLVHNFC